MESEKKQIHEYEGGCLCDETTYIAKGEPINPHLCSCTMCQKSSGAPTVAWVEFSLKEFKWTGSQPNLYRSSEKTLRCSCKKCGGLLGTLNDGYENVCITISTLRNPSLIVPSKQHSYKENAPSWWVPKILNKSINQLNTGIHLQSNQCVKNQKNERKSGL